MPKRCIRRNSFWCLVLVLVAGGAGAGERHVVGAFESGDLEGWEPEVFVGETRYEIVELNGRQALYAHSDGTASGLYREIEIDLTETPYLNWRWKVGNVLEDLDETTEAGDDYAARVYVVVSSGVLFWRTWAISYVWSGSQPEGATWPNAYTEHVEMVAVASGEERVGEWVTHRRNIREDFRERHGRDIDRIDAVALMTDTDDSGLEAEAWYGDIWFSAE